MKTRQLLQKMVATIVAEIGPEQVILFGSHARGNATENHAQQAAEKLPKANPSLPGKPCPAIHGLTRPLELLEAHRPETEDHSSELIASNPCAAQLRDSAGDPGLSPPDRNAAYSFWKNFRRGAERTWRKIDLRQVLAANMPSRLHRPARPPSDRLRLA